MGAFINIEYRWSSFSDRWTFHFFRLYNINIRVYIYIYNKLYTMPSSIPKLVQPHLGPPWGVLHSHAMVAPSTLAAHVGGDGRYCKALADPDCTKIIHKSVGQWVVITEYIWIYHSSDSFQDGWWNWWNVSFFHTHSVPNNGNEFNLVQNLCSWNQLARYIIWAVFKTPVGWWL